MNVCYYFCALVLPQDAEHPLCPPHRKGLAVRNTSQIHAVVARVVKMAELRLCLPEEHLQYSSAGVIVSASWPYASLSYLQENILQSLLSLFLQIGVSQRVVIQHQSCQQSPCCLSSKFPGKASCSWISSSLR